MTSVSSSKNRRAKKRQLERQHSRSASAIDPFAPGQGVVAQARLQMAAYSGPIPPPALLKQFDELVPGEASRILRLAEDQARHRMKLESSVTTSDIKRSWTGLAAGLVVSLAAIWFGFQAIIAGFPAAGATLATGSIVGLASVFIYGTNSQRKERVEKTRMMTRKR